MLKRTIIVLRHAEKPTKDGKAIGIDEHGRPDDRALTVRGWQRAGAWAALFGQCSANYPQPDVIYAANPDRRADGTLPSRRSYLTAQPIAERLSMTVNDGFYQGGEAKLAETIMKQEARVSLVVWEHKRIGEALLPELFKRGTGPAESFRGWDPKRFDVALLLDFDGDSWTQRQLFPLLLSGDTVTSM